MNYFMSLHEFDWEKCVGGLHRCMQLHGKPKQGTSSSHQSKSDKCDLDALHDPQRALAAKHLSEELYDILKTVISAIKGVYFNKEEGKVYQENV